eukprot:jgi/Antlo1/1558/918
MNISKPIGLLLTMVVSSFQHHQFDSGETVVLIKGRCGDHPASICKKNGYAPVWADACNIGILLQILRNNCVDSAFVGGWNGQPANLVLRSNGALAPYCRVTNDANHAFCKLPCPCPPYRQAETKPVPCVEKKVVPVCPTPAPVACAGADATAAVYVQPQQCPPSSYANAEAIAYVQQPQWTPGPPCRPCIPPAPCMPCRPPRPPTLCKPCPIFAAHLQKVCSRPRRIGRCGDRICKEVKDIQVARSYVFSKCPRNKRCDVEVKVEDAKRISDTKYVMLSQYMERNAPYPNILKFPENLSKVAYCVHKKFCVEPCLYVGGKCCDQLFVFLKGRLYHIKLSLREFARREFRCDSLHLAKVRKHDMRKLINRGLARIVLDGTVF